MTRERVLVVDDDESIRHVVGLFLEDEGFEVRAAANGQEALDVAQDFQPHVILLDLRMPVMDGYQFVEHYRDLPGPSAVIIAFVATLHAEQDRERIGAASLLEKPFDLDELLRAISEARMTALPVAVQAKTYTGVPTSHQSQANLASL